MGRIITIASAKGGVGKTFLTCNLAAALAQFNRSVVAVDGNLTTPNLGIHLGITMYPATLQDVIKKDADIKDAMYMHQAGFKVLPADISLKKFTKADASELIGVLYELAENTDFVLVDSAAGLGREALASIEAADELITITNPEMPALVDALKLIKMANKLDVENLGIVLNKIRNDKTDVPAAEVEDFLKLNIIGKIPDDRNVRVSIAKKEPVLLHRPNAISSLRIKEIGANLAGVDWKPNGFLFRMFGWLK